MDFYELLKKIFDSNLFFGERNFQLVKGKGQND